MCWFACIFIVGLFIFSFVFYVFPLRHPAKEATLHSEIWISEWPLPIWNVTCTLSLCPWVAVATSRQHSLPRVTKGPFVSWEARSGCRDILFSRPNKAAHVPCLSRPTTCPIVPALLTTFRGETGKRNPLLLASLNQSWFFFPSLCATCCIKTPAKGPTHALPKKNTNCELPPPKGMKLPILIESPKLAY